jgi:hypothetical protein
MLIKMADLLKSSKLTLIFVICLLNVFNMISTAEANASYNNNVTTPFISLPERKDIFFDVILVLAIAAMICALACTCYNAYKCRILTDKMRIIHGYMAFLMSLFLIFCGTSLVGLLSDSPWVAFSSTILNWSITILTMTLLALLVRINWKDYKKVNFELLQNTSFRVICAVELAIWFISIGCAVYLTKIGMIGPDNASQYTLHYYVNTSMADPDIINFSIKLL